MSAAALPARSFTDPVGRLLVVEDNDLVLGLTTMVLKTQGHTVVEAVAPGDALRLLAEAEAPFDLLLTDLVLPGINGYELAEQALAVSPGLSVLFVSGYAAPATLPPIHGATAARFLPKPYSPQQLVDAVAGVLAATRL